VRGLVLGFGQSNIDAYPLIESISTTGSSALRAYLASALVWVYDQLGPDLQSCWQTMVRSSKCAVAAAERIVELATTEGYTEALAQNGLLQFALELSTSELPRVRAQMLGTLLTARGQLREDGLESTIRSLVYDTDEIVSAAALYCMLRNSQLRDEHRERFADLVRDSSLSAVTAKLILYTNATGDVPDAVTEEVEAFRYDRAPRPLRNTALFHVAAQLPFLPPLWTSWLEQQVASGDEEVKTVVSLARRFHAKNTGDRAIFRPDWLLDYTDLDQLVTYLPTLRRVALAPEGDASGWVWIRDVDELEMIFRVREKFPEHLVC
jgi:hypothetical protein